MKNPATMFLAPACCTDGETGRLWCEDNVWPCNDCPDKSQAVPGVYRLDDEAVRLIGDRLRAEALKVEQE